MHVVSTSFADVAAERLARPEAAGRDVETSAAARKHVERLLPEVSEHLPASTAAEDVDGH